MSGEMLEMTPDNLEMQRVSRKLPRVQWSLRSFLLGNVFLFFAIGFVSTVRTTADAYVFLLFRSWDVSIYRMIESWNIDPDFSARYLVFLWQNFPGWFTLSTLCFFLALLERKRWGMASGLALAIIGSLPLCEFLDVWILGFENVLGSHLLIMPFCGMALCFTAWYVGIKLPFRKWEDETTHGAGNVKNMLLAMFLVIFLLVGLEGWWVFGAISMSPEL